jgi:hypothetical protein
MAEASDALDGDEIAGARAGVAQCVVDGDACAEQQSGFVGRETIGHESDGLGGSNHVPLIAAVEVNGSDLLELAVDEIAAAAGIALEAVSAVPSDGNPLAGFPQGHVGSEGVDGAGDFVARDARILKARPYLPSFTRASLWQMPRASTLIRTCPRPGSGLGRSTIAKFPPGLPIWTVSWRAFLNRAEGFGLRGLSYELPEETQKLRSGAARRGRRKNEFRVGSARISRVAARTSPKQDSARAAAEAFVRGTS